MSDQLASKVEIETTLRQLNEEWVKALVRRDGTTLDRIMAEDFIFAYPFEGDDKAQFVGDVVSGDLRVDHITRENVTVRIWGGTAILIAKDSSKWFYRGHEWSGLYKIMNVYSQRNGDWQLVAVQACHIS